MKKITVTALLLITCGIFVASAQETARERMNRNAETRKNGVAADLPVRTAQMNRHDAAEVSEAKWLRQVYRYLDLSKEENAPLYYPVMPEQGRMNLFAMIFRLLAEDKIAAYEYLDGREMFTPEYKIDFGEFINRFGILHEIRNGQISVADVDIPANEVQGYFVKEAYYFETGTSNYGVKTVAICPVLLRQNDYDANTIRYPLFWIPYDQIMPYTMRMPIMTSSLNNAMSGTIDDFFRKRSYNGEIYKTANPRNLAISQYTSTPEEMKAEQEKIERQLRDFELRLWKENTDSTVVKPVKQNRRVKRAVSNIGSNTMRDRRF